jgi:hypothetical protein
LGPTIALLLIHLVATLGLASPSAAGVPSIDVDYSQDVEAWWARHPFNPASPGYAPTIDSPAPVLDVKAQFGGDIQAALAALPAEGGTLYLAPGSYGRFEVVGRSNVHFLGADRDSVFVRGGTFFGCELARDYAAFQSGYVHGDAAARACGRDRPRNIYIRDVTFDGGNEPTTIVENTAYGVAVFLRAYRDVVFERVSFRNYSDVLTWHPGLVSGNGLLDNIWCRQCHFIGRMRWGWFLDGCRGCGVLGSRFEAAFGSGYALFLTNDDFTQDLDGDGTFSLAEQRNAQYNVLAGNTFVGGAGPDIVSVTGMQNLLQGNTLEGYARSFGRFWSRCSQRWSSRGFEYLNYGNRVVGNRLGEVQNLTMWEAEAGSTNCPNPASPGRLGRYEIRDNAVQNGARFQTLAVDLGQVDGPNVVAANAVSGR